MSIRTSTLRLVMIPIVGVAVVAHHSFSEDSVRDAVYEASGYFLLAAGAIGRIWCAAFIAGRKNAVLVTEGPYSVVRNPLYFFSFLGFVGVGLAFEMLSLAIVLGTLFFLTHWPTILSEERRLAGLFGAAFQSYKNAVPRFIPDFRKLQQPASVSISPRVFSRVVMESFLVLCVFMAAELIERIHLVHPSLVLMHLP